MSRGIGLNGRPQLSQRKQLSKPCSLIKNNIFFLYLAKIDLISLLFSFLPSFFWLVLWIEAGAKWFQLAEDVREEGWLRVEAQHVTRESIDNQDATTPESVSIRVD